MSVLEVKFRNDEVFLQKHHEMTLDNYIKQISIFDYDKFYEKYRNSKDETGAEKAQFPPINYVFYTYIFLNTSVPSPQKLIEEYFKIYKGMFEIHPEQNLVKYKGTKYSYSTVIGRILRTYPSLVRDFHFFLMLKEICCVTTFIIAQQLHQTEKLMALMRELVHICEAGGTVLDPFAGSGSILASAILEGYSTIGVEKDDHYINVARQRVLEAMKTRLLDGVKSDL